MKNFAETIGIGNIIACAFIFGSFIFFLNATIFYSHKKKKIENCTLEVNAKVVYLQRKIESGAQPTFEYTVDGKIYKTRHVWWSKSYNQYEENKEYKILVDPNDPKSIYVPFNDGSKSQIIVGVLGGIAMLIASIIAFAVTHALK